MDDSEVPANSMYGSQTCRALDNFGVSPEKMYTMFIKAFAYVKQACVRTNSLLGYMNQEKADLIEAVCKEIIAGEHHDEFVVSPFQGGAGTSTNMNFNEVIANLANAKAGQAKGEFSYIHPLKDVNMHQSTNDVYPTSLKVAILLYLKELEKSITFLQEALQEKEREFQNVVKTGRTQLQDAVPLTLGMEFSAYSDAIARDRWRIFKSRERIKVVNLGGTAIGTGLGAPRKYIFKVTEVLRRLTGLNLARGENLVDATQNVDAFAEVSGMLKAFAANLFKIANDLRLLSSGPQGGLGEINLPKVQKGSTIMPTKVNPVIPEFVAQSALQVMGNDAVITQVTALGNLELNQFLPLLTHNIMQSLELLNTASIKFRTHCIDGITANEEVCRQKLYNSPIIATVLVPVLGYDKVEEIVTEAGKNKQSISEYLTENKIISEEKIQEILSPTKMYKLGYTDDELRF